MSAAKQPTEAQLRDIAAAERARYPEYKEGYVMIYDVEVCGWALKPEAHRYIPGVAAVPESGPILWTAGGTRDAAERMATSPEPTPRKLAPGIPEEVTAAIEQLHGSERGTKAGAGLAGLIYNGGSGLDSNNWRALETLCRACRMAGGNTAIKIAEALSK